VVWLNVLGIGVRIKQDRSRGDLILGCMCSLTGWYATEVPRQVEEGVIIAPDSLSKLKVLAMRYAESAERASAVAPDESSTARL
jgi:hypothetical protein